VRLYSPPFHMQLTSSSSLTTLLYTLPCSVSISPYHATTNVYVFRFRTRNLDLPASFDLLISFPLYHTTKPIYIHTSDLALPAFYFDPLIPKNNITSDVIALRWAPDPHCRCSGHTHRAQNIPLVKNWYLKHCTNTELDLGNSENTQRLHLLKHSQATGAQLSATPASQDVHPTAYTSVASMLGLGRLPLLHVSHRVCSVYCPNSYELGADVPHHPLITAAETSPAPHDSRVGYPLPIPFCKGKCRPWDLLFNTTIMTNCCLHHSEDVNHIPRGRNMPYLHPSPTRDIWPPRLTSDPHPRDSEGMRGAPPPDSYYTRPSRGGSILPLPPVHTSRPCSPNRPVEVKGIVPEDAKVFCSQQTQVTARGSHDQEEPFPAVEGYQILPDDEPRLGRGWTASLPARIQYTEPTYPPEGLCSPHVSSEVR